MWYDSGEKMDMAKDVAVMDEATLTRAGFRHTRTGAAHEYTPSLSLKVDNDAYMLRSHLFISRNALPHLFTPICTLNLTSGRIGVVGLS